MSSSSQDEPPQVPSHVDTNQFFHQGSGLSALLIHGLSGTPYEMRYLGESLAASGIRVLGVRLAGHAGTPEELGRAHYDAWYESVIEGFEQMRSYGDPVVVVGLSAGAVLAARLAADQGEAVAGLVMLSPAFFLSIWASAVLRTLGRLGPVSRRLYLHSDASDIHDSSARRIHPGTRLMPLSAPIELLKLSDRVRPKLGRITQPTLVIHSVQDHVCPYDRNVGFLMSRIGSEQKRAVTLTDSYHVISVDSDRERVSQEVLAFASPLRLDSWRREMEQTRVQARPANVC